MIFKYGKNYVCGDGRCGKMVAPNGTTWPNGKPYVPDYILFQCVTGAYFHVNVKESNWKEVAKLPVKVPHRPAEIK